MKFKDTCRPWLVCSTDATRPSINDARLDGDRLIATNGFCLASIKVEREETDTDGQITVEAMRAASKLKGVLKNLIRANGALEILGQHGNVQFRRPEVDFPAWRQVMPAFKRGDEGTFTFHLDARLLAKLSEAIGCDGRVSLTVLRNDKKGGKGANRAALVVEPFVDDDGGESFGVLMPLTKPNER